MSPQPDDYEYDVFFSYKRDDLTLEWTRQVYRRLKLWLGQELNRPANLFVDEEAIEVGNRWPEELRLGLARSRCMVCLWSPLYFQSSWCVSEWKSFLARERRIGANSHGLIAPLNFHDGEHFPAEAQRVQWIDVSAYASTLPAFWQSQRALELEDRLKVFARQLAGVVRSAPPFEPDWPILEEPGLSPPKIALGSL